LKCLYELPLLELIARANQVHHQFHPVNQIQVCQLISVKTGGCSEDCKYCAQSSRYQTAVSAQPMMTYEEVMQIAKQAVNRGATRVCLGAAWRGVREGKAFDVFLKMIQDIHALGVEVCCTLGMLTEEQAKQLQRAGLHSYNHNLDSSESFYKTIITTRTYEDRLKTLKHVRQAGLKVCCGGIIGMGEHAKDRLELLQTLSRLNPHPESVPINRLTAIPGTPLENQPETSIWELVRLIAVARIVLPTSLIRLSSGRSEMNHEQHALCFLAGANSIHVGEKLLTVPNKAVDQDEEMFAILGLKKKPAKYD
jgi:biotin synthase